MKHVEQGNAAGENWNRSLDILSPKIDVPIARRRDARSLANFPRIKIESEDRLLAATFPKIKRQQTQTAPDIEDRFGRAAKQLVGRGKNGIAPQLAADVTTQPTLGKVRSHAGASRFVPRSIISPAFHLIRIIALPD